MEYGRNIEEKRSQTFPGLRAGSGRGAWRYRGVVVRCLTKHRFELNQGTYYIFPGRFFRLEIDSFSPAFAGTADAGEVCIF